MSDSNKPKEKETGKRKEKGKGKKKGKGKGKQEQVQAGSSDQDMDPFAHVPVLIFSDDNDGEEGNMHFCGPHIFDIIRIDEERFREIYRYYECVQLPRLRAIHAQRQRVEEENRIKEATEPRPARTHAIPPQPLAPMLLRNGVSTYASERVEDWYEEQYRAYVEEAELWEQIESLRSYTTAMKEMERFIDES